MFTSIYQQAEVIESLLEGETVEGVYHVTQLPVQFDDDFWLDLKVMV